MIPFGEIIKNQGQRVGRGIGSKYRPSLFIRLVVSVAQKRLLPLVFTHDDVILNSRSQQPRTRLGYVVSISFDPDAIGNFEDVFEN